MHIIGILGNLIGDYIQFCICNSVNRTMKMYVSKQLCSADDAK